MRAGIIGMGHVGTCMLTLFRGHADLVTFDIARGEDYPQDELSTCDFAVVCVNTPADVGGACDTTQVVEAIKRLPMERVLLKSTVAPGTTEYLCDLTGKQICFSPEYIGQSTYHQTFPPDDPTSALFTVFGGTPAVRTFFIDALLPILGPSHTYYQCTSVEAEVIKYMENAYLATKVTFVNEFHEICQALGADWHMVRQGWLLDPRVGPAHTAVFRSDRGFAGNCLPKDLAAIVHAATQAGYHPQLLAEVIASNQRLRSGARR